VSAAGPDLARRRLLRALAVSAVVTGCASPASRPAGRAGPVPASPPSWVLARQALAQVTADRAIAAGLAKTRVYELVQPGQQPLALAGALPAVAFSAASELVSAVRGNGLPARTQAVLYDPEAWSFTPPAEQGDPVSAAAAAAAAAHAAGLQLIVAPALILTTVLAPGSRAPRSQLFLELGLAERLARHADVLEFQAQSLERDTDQYASFVAAAARQARRVSPRIGLLAGLSTNPPGAEVSSSQVVAAMQASRDHVDGFWLNIPGPGPRCPTCNPIRPDIGITALLAVL
jgi:hypothetical protein